MAGANRGWGGHLLLGPYPGVAAYIGPGGLAADHAHHAVQAGVGLDAPVRLSLDGEPEIETSVFVVGRDRRHSFRSDGQVAIVYADPSSSTGRRLAAADGAVHVDGLGPVRAEELAEDDAVLFVTELLSRFGIPEAVDDELSSPVAAAVDYVEDAIRRGEAVSLSGAAERAALSMSRLRHLFVDQVGIPFRPYVLWSRLVHVVERIGHGADLTRAAADAGFSDSAHLSRTFRANFGLPPSALLLMRVTPGVLTRRASS